MYISQLKRQYRSKHPVLFQKSRQSLKASLFCLFLRKSFVLIMLPPSSVSILFLKMDCSNTICRLFHFFLMQHYFTDNKKQKLFFFLSFSFFLSLNAKKKMPQQVTCAWCRAVPPGCKSSQKLCLKPAKKFKIFFPLMGSHLWDQDLPRKYSSQIDLQHSFIPGMHSEPCSIWPGRESSSRQLSTRPAGRLCRRELL